MLVCLCLGVCDKEVKMTIRGGARSVDAITRACGAGGDCGSCHAMLGKMIDTHEAQENEHRAVASLENLIGLDQLAAVG